jgi:hypothetical protein
MPPQSRGAGIGVIGGRMVVAVLGETGFLQLLNSDRKYEE